MSRECGPCHACCIATKIPALNKPPWYPCRHLCNSGCSIHPKVTDDADARPSICRDFSCMWRLGQMEERHRPDQLGLIFAATTDPDTKRNPTGVMMHIWEVWPDAVTQPDARQYFENLIRRYPTQLHSQMEPVAATIGD